VSGAVVLLSDMGKVDVADPVLAIEHHQQTAIGHWEITRHAVPPELLDGELKNEK
jgi:hypothetical protein